MKCNPDDVVYPEVTTYEGRSESGEIFSDVNSGGGITIREYFAMAIMQGLVSREPQTHDAGPRFACKAVQYADHLIAELNKPKEEKNDGKD